MKENVKDLIKILEKERYSIALMKYSRSKFIREDSSQKLAVILDVNDADYAFIDNAFQSYNEIRVFSSL